MTWKTEELTKFNMHITAVVYYNETTRRYIPEGYHLHS
jgi:hypothetical protein